MVHYLGGLELMLLGLHLCLERLAGMNCLHWTGVQELLRKGKGQRAKGKGQRVEVTGAPTRWRPHLQLVFDSASVCARASNCAASTPARS